MQTFFLTRQTVSLGSSSSSSDSIVFEDSDFERFDNEETDQGVVTGVEDEDTSSRGADDWEELMRRLLNIKLTKE